MPFVTLNSLLDPYKPVLVSGGSHSCIIIPLRKRLQCWGNNDNIQSKVPLGYGNYISSSAVGLKHSCAVKFTHLFCWGENRANQTDVPLALEYTAKSVVSGYRHNLVITTHNRVGCFGQNYYGECDVPDLSQVIFQNIKHDEINISDILGTNVDVIMVISGNNHSCVLVSDFIIQIPGNDIPKTQNPCTDSSKNVNKQPIGYYITITKCWGLNNYSQTDLSDKNQFDNLYITSGSHHSCAIGHDKKISCWGSNEHRQKNFMGVYYYNTGHGCKCDETGQGYEDNDTFYFNQTLHFSSEAGVLTAGFAHSCAVYVVGLLECVGSNGLGQTAIPSGMDRCILTVSAGNAFTCAVKINRLVCWGDNKYGQLNVPEVLRFNKYYIDSNRVQNNYNHFATRVLNWRLNELNRYIEDVD